jgi:hypothetical protein
MFFPIVCQVAADGACEEKDHNDGRSDPERPVQIRIAFHDIQKVLLGKQRGATSQQDLIGIDIKELLVER